MKSWKQKVYHTLFCTFFPWKDPYRFRLLYRGLLIAILGAIFVIFCGLTLIKPSDSLPFWREVFVIIVLDLGFCCVLGLLLYVVAILLYVVDQRDAASRFGEWGTACIWWWLLPLTVLYLGSCLLSS